MAIVIPTISLNLGTAMILNKKLNRSTNRDIAIYNRLHMILLISFSNKAINLLTTCTLCLILRLKTNCLRCTKFITFFIGLYNITFGIKKCAIKKFNSNDSIRARA